jgi:hypothetical protein
MARRLVRFPSARPRDQRKYPWEEWTDGSPWKIRQGEDYDVASENMRVNLHMKAGTLSLKVRTHKVQDDRGEGLVFQFYRPEETEVASKQAAKDVHDVGTATRSLYEDAMEIYERARREVTIQRKDGRRQRYAPVRYMQAIQKGHAEGRLPETIARIVSRRTEGFGHLEAAGRPDLMLETLILDPDKPYHGLFSAVTIMNAGSRMAQYYARHP